MDSRDLALWLRQHRVAAAALAGCLVLALALAWTAWRWDIASDRLALLERQAAEGFLRPPSATRSLRIDTRAGGAAFARIGLLPERLELLIAVPGDRYDRFRVALFRDDGTSLLHADRLARDSNGDLRLALNSSLLPDGGYRLRIEGYTWRGELQPVAEGRLVLSGRPAPR